MQPLNDEIEIEVESEEDNERRGSESEETNGEGGETLFDLFRRTWSCFFFIFYFLIEAW